MKNLFTLSLALFISAAIFASCSDDDSENLPEQNEVTVEPFLMTNSTATIKCSYRPSKSIVYQLQIGNTVSEKYSKGKFLKILNLSPGKEYTVKTTIFNANQKAIGMSKISLTTTNTASSDDMVIATQPIRFEEVE